VGLVSSILLFLDKFIENKLDKNSLTELIRLPFCSSTTECESFFEKLFALELSKETRSYYEDKYEKKELWSMTFKKTLPCLKINTTSRIESLNALIKSEISSSSRLIELFYRLLSIHENILSKGYSDTEHLSQQALAVLENSKVLSKFKDKVSDYLYNQLALSCSQALKLDVTLYNGVYNVKENNTLLMQITKDDLNCTCKHFMSLGIPCMHLVAVANRYPNISLHEKIRGRWTQDHSSLDGNDEFLHKLVKDFLNKSAES